MAKKNKNYWRQRELNIDKVIWKEIEKEILAMYQAYDMTSKNIEAQINNFYFRFSNENNLSYADAKKILTTKEREAYQMSLEEYIAKGKTLKYTQMYSEQLQNASTVHRVSRLETLQTQINQEIAELTSVYQKTASNLMDNTYKESYNKNAFTLEGITNARFDIIDNETAQLCTSQAWTWDGKTFSDRIWDNQKELVNFLNTELKNTLLSGTNPDKLIKEVVEKFGVKKRAARNLLETEAAFFNSEAKKSFYDKASVKKYQIDATIDHKTSDTCIEQDGKMYDLEDWEVGVTAPPFHNHCRSTTIPGFDDLDSFDIENFDDSEAAYKEWKTKKEELQQEPSTDKIQVEEDFNDLVVRFKKDYNIQIDDNMSELNLNAVRETLEGFESVLNRFDLSSYVKDITAFKNVEYLGFDISGTLVFNPEVYQTYQAMQKATSNQISKVGAHEAGHVIELALIEKVVKENDSLNKFELWDECTIAGQLVISACRNVSGGTTKNYRTLVLGISEYALETPSECLAEAVSDYYANGDNASELSKEICRLIEEEFK